jgi:hypothetical protein
MKRKILALVFAAAMLLGFPNSAECGSGNECHAVTVLCAGGGGGEGIVCDAEDVKFLTQHLCPDMYYLIIWH